MAARPLFPGPLGTSSLLAVRQGTQTRLRSRLARDRTPERGHCSGSLRVSEIWKLLSQICGRNCWRATNLWNRVRQVANVEYQVPNVLVRLHFTKCRHATQANAILHNPEKLAIGIGLRVARGEICRSWIHPPARISWVVPIVTMASTTFCAKKSLALLDTLLPVGGRWWNPFAAALTNEIVLRPGGQERFRSSWLRQCAQR